MGLDAEKMQRAENICSGKIGSTMKSVARLTADNFMSDAAQRPKSNVRVGSQLGIGQSASALYKDVYKQLSGGSNGKR